MGKHKKKKHSKQEDLTDDVLLTAAASIKKFRKVTNEMGKLSTGQKLLGGLALVAAGLIYLDQRRGHLAGSGSRSASSPAMPKLLEAKTASATQEGEQAETASPHKSRKNAKTRKTHGPATRKPSAATDDVG